MSDFHLLRPEWLLLLIPLFLTLFLTIKKQRLAGQWQKLIHPTLQAYVMSESDQKPSQQALKTGPLFVTALLTVIALSGPTWEKENSPVFNSRAGLIIALDLSLSMSAQDVAPSRLQRAKYKITDVLEAHNDQSIGLIAYSGDAHTAAPLTRDIKTIQSMLPALDPYIMPAQGSNLVRLAEQAVELFNQSGSQPKQLLLVTDGVESQDIQASADLLNANQIDLAILAVGTEQGAPIVRPDGRFFKDQKGNVIMPELEWSNLQELAQATGARITKLASNDSDIKYLIKDYSSMSQFDQTESDIEFDQWHDAGYWLVLACLPLALFGFRKGLLICLIAITFPQEKTWAFEWQDLFRNSDQRGMARFRENPSDAADSFSDPKWKASSLYKAEKYEDAANAWSQFDDANSHYNRGNALAKQNKLDEAIAAYDDALAKNPDHENAQANKSLLEQLKQQQDQQKDQQQNNEQQSGENGEQQEGQQQNADQQNAQKQDGEQSQSSDSENQQAENQQQNQGEQSGDQSEPDFSQADQSNPDEPSSEESQQQMAKPSQEEDGEPQSEQELAKQDEEGKDGSEERDKFNQVKQLSQQSTEDTEQSQAMKQWLQRVPDDPGGLLRNKFLYQYKNRDQEAASGDRKPW